MKNIELFVYGSLCDEALRRRLLRRDVATQPAYLNGYRAFFLTGEPYPALRRFKSAITVGLLLSGLNQIDMRRLDRYEGSLYQRRKLRICTEKSCQRSWVYVLRSRARRRLGQKHYFFS